MRVTFTKTETSLFHSLIHYLHIILQLFLSALRINRYHFPRIALRSSTSLPFSSFVSQFSFLAVATFILFQVPNSPFAPHCDPLPSWLSAQLSFCREAFPHHPGLGCIPLSCAFITPWVSPLRQLLLGESYVYLHMLDSCLSSSH